MYGITEGTRGITEGTRGITEGTRGITEGTRGLTWTILTLFENPNIIQN
jgi:hypothetical protein